MPHVIYLHSELVQSRNKDSNDDEKKNHLRLERLDITIAMNIAFVVNAAMLVVSAAVFFRNGMDVNSIEQAHQSLTPLLGTLSSVFFGLALIASGLSSSAVGTMAGQTIMQGFVGLNINENLIKLITMAPGIVIILIGIQPMQALVLSQVVLSFVLPIAIIPMILITNKKDLMGIFVNKPLVNIIGWLITGIIICMNAILVCKVFYP
jgi:manganese transport protein